MRFQEKNGRELGKQVRAGEEDRIKMWIPLKSNLNPIPEGALGDEYQFPYPTSRKEGQAFIPQYQSVTDTDHP